MFRAEESRDRRSFRGGEEGFEFKNWESHIHRENVRAQSKKFTGSILNNLHFSRFIYELKKNGVQNCKVSKIDLLSFNFLKRESGRKTGLG